MTQSINPFAQKKWELNEHGNSKLKRSLTLHSKMALGIATLLVAVVVTVIVVCTLVSSTNYWLPSNESSSRLGRFKSAAVSTDAAPCAAIGRDMLDKNGSAVDATIAVLLCMGVVNPQSSGLGGGFLMLFYNRKEQKVYYIDAREVAPKNAKESMYGGNATLSKLGPLSVAVPAEVAGFSYVHKKYGKLPWADLFEPSIRMCKEGIEVDAHLDRALKKYEKEMMFFPTTRDIFVNNETGKLLQKNDVYQRLDLAATLEVIAKENSAALYGDTEMAKNFMKDLQKAGCILVEEDMVNYEVKSRNPVRVTLLNNVTLYSSSLPGGGELLALILQVMEGYLQNNASVSSSKQAAVLFLHRLIESFKFAFAKRMELEDVDSKEMQKLVERLVSREYADEVRAQIDDSRTYDDPTHYGINVTVTEDHGTAHVSVVSPSGDAVAATSTVNHYFGSMVISPSTGILLNNEMDDFSSSSIVSFFGVPPSIRNHIQPGRRPVSSMSPSILVGPEGDVRLVVGGNGGTQIITSVAQVIIRNLWLKENIKQSIDAPRFHHQLLPNLLQVEPTFPFEILSDLKKLGHKTALLGENMVGIIMAIAKEADGLLYANSDYRKAGEVDGF